MITARRSSLQQVLLPIQKQTLEMIYNINIKEVLKLKNLGFDNGSSRFIRSFVCAV